MEYNKVKDIGSFIELEFSKGNELFCDIPKKI